ncbi:MAG: DUF5947 family protein [Byssovorax sp.]
MSDEATRDVERQMDRIEALIRGVESSSDAAGRDAARELVATLLDLHGKGLAKVIALLAGAGDPGRTIAAECAGDPVVRGMLALHELDALAPSAAGRVDPGPLVQIRLPRREITPGERCDLCSLAIADEHPHLIDPAARALVCVCDACAMLFHDPRPDARYVRVPRRGRSLDDLRITDAQWDALGVPVHLAFFFRSSRTDRVIALYPSPAGAMESLLPLGAWDEIAAQNPALRTMAPDVEALLVHRVGDARRHLLAPIDRCFELTGMIRRHRTSILGSARSGADLEIEGFLQRLREEACPAG